MVLEATLPLLTAWGAFCLAALSPGPNLAAVAAMALDHGRPRALMVASGIALGAFLWALSASLGLALILARFPALITVMSVLGGSYLLYLGIKALGAALRTKTADIATANRSPGHAFLQGLMVTATNPKVALFWTAISTLVAKATESVALLILFATIVAALALLIYGGLGVLLSVRPLRRAYGKAQRGIEAAFGVVFLSMGSVLLVAGLGR